MSASLYQTVFESRMNMKRGIDLHYHPRDRFMQRVSRIDLGRQTGKTKAIVRMMSDNHQHDYMLFTISGRHAGEVAERYKKQEAGRIETHENFVQMTGNQHSQIQKAYRNHTQTGSRRKLCIFVEEPTVQTAIVLETLFEIFGSTEIDYQIFVVGCQ